jgi:hypothetical protein
LEPDVQAFHHAEFTIGNLNRLVGRVCFVVAVDRFSTIQVPLLLWFSEECANRDFDHEEP